ncbi:hypothetical protein [Hymenobacter aerophilus]|uniref:hypothetical protein n=1 Tax=Hymenobacter aerophilus TaxID=119644 RepID=UPI00196A123C|nr:hypothetical protein [Hymenobacter aerophilus]
MPADESPLAALQSAAEAVRHQLRLNAYDEAAVQRLAEFIEVQRPIIKDEEREGVIKTLGCFLGQCLVQTYGGTWAQNPQGVTGVGLHDVHFFNPFYRVGEQLAKGSEHSVATFFASISERLAAGQPARKNWIQ